MSYKQAELKTLPLRERPVYRITDEGPGVCNLVEVVAAVVGGARQIEIARDLVARYGNLVSMSKLSARQIETETTGLGRAGAARLKAALEIGLRLAREEFEDRSCVRSPADVGSMFVTEMSALEQEHFRIVLLNTRNHLIAVKTVHIGTLNRLHVRLADVFRHAVRENAAAVIVVHNHPSGDCTPSPEDGLLTRELVKAGKLMGIDVLDHVVIGGGKFVSMSEKGIGFE